jgi:hypothetical protein
VEEPTNTRDWLKTPMLALPARHLTGTYRSVGMEFPRTGSSLGQNSEPTLRRITNL